MTQEQALKILKTGRSIFLTGEPGSGKTHTVNSYISYLKNHGVEPAVTASTGIAATHIGGITIHSWSGIGIKRELSQRDLHRILDNNRLAKRIKRTEVLIIDEISMLDAGTLSMVDRVCQKIRESKYPFGGMQVVLVGDFFQLPPVAKEGEAAKFAFESEAWENLDPHICYISEQYRQEDETLLSILSGIRSENINEEHICHIEKCRVSKNNIARSITKLFSHNVDVDIINSKELELLSGKTHLFKMVSFGPAPLVEAIKRGCLSPEDLYLKEGASVMFTKNSITGKYVNGTLGTVVGFDKESGMPRVKTRRGKIITAEPVDWTVEENGRVKAGITQVPLRLAWAITIHKSQGISLDAAVMDLSGVFEYGQGYVALSRVRTLSGLFLLGLNEHSFLVHPDISEKDKEFRERSLKTSAEFANISDAEQRKNEEKFLEGCGGKLEKIRNKNDEVDTYSATLALFKEGTTIAEIAKERELKEGTIISHLENLISYGKIKSVDVYRLIEPAFLKNIPEIQAVFHELGDTKLSPVYERFGGKYSYDDLRFARMTMEESEPIKF